MFTIYQLVQDLATIHSMVDDISIFLGGIATTITKLTTITKVINIY